MVQRFVCDGLVFKIEDFKKPSLPHMRVFVEDADFAALEQRFDALSSKFAALVEEKATLRKRLDESCRFTVDPDSEFAKDSMELKEGDNANSSHILG